MCIYIYIYIYISPSQGKIQPTVSLIMYRFCRNLGFLFYLPVERDKISERKSESQYKKSTYSNLRVIWKKLLLSSF